MIKAILMILNALAYISCFDESVVGTKKPFDLYFGTYSMWGVNMAFLSQVFSILACYYEGWFRLAYIATELSFSVNTIVVLIYWPSAWRLFLPSTPTKNIQSRLTSIFCHVTPILTTISDLAMTDMALEKRHWYMMMPFMFPFYACLNYIFSYRLGSFVHKGKMGDIYGFEKWDTDVPGTLLIFVIGAFLQGGLYYCFSAIVEKIWPKRAEEEFAINTFDKAAKVIDNHLP